MKTDDDKNLGDPIPIKFTAEVESMIRDLETHSGLPRSTVVRRCVRFAMDEVQRRGDADWLLYDEKTPIGFLKKSAVAGEEPTAYKTKPKSSPKRKVGTLVDIRSISLSVLGVSSCGRLLPSVSEVLTTIEVPVGKYPEDAFGVYAQGDSMNRAKLPDGQRRINDGDIVICRSIQHESPAVGKIVVAIHEGDTAIKLLCEDRHGRFLAPQSSNNKHKSFRIHSAAEVQAVVIGKV